MTFAHVLGLLEFFLVPASIAWLCAAPFSRSRRSARWSIGLAILLALTVAQPFGIVATPQAAPPAGAHQVDATSVHVVRAGGSLPVMPFVLYREDYVWSGENAPTAMLKARSWFWLPILTNATTVDRICADDVLQPCFGNAHEEYAAESNLRLAQSGGTYYATLLNPGASRAPNVPTSYTWKLAPGIASSSGVVYWLLIAVLIPIVVWSSRGDDADRLFRRLPRTSRAATSIMLIGGALWGLLGTFLLLGLLMSSSTP